MEQNIKTWIEALRSGQYQQTEHSLCNAEGFCCLGVFAKVNKVVSNEDEFYKGYERVDGEGPSWIYKEIHSQLYDSGLSGSITEELIHMNDNGYSFDDIADRIEAYYKAVA